MKILITAGPTREKIDTVRFISNRSSGKMGYALAEAAVKGGNKVTLVSGPVSLAAPHGVKLVKIESAAEMAAEVYKEASDADVIIMAAAVADYKPKLIYEGKLKKSEDPLVLELECTEDILENLGKKKKKGQFLVGFAAETSDLLKNAEKKLKEKNLDWIIANDISKSDRGFAVDTNAVTLLSRDGRKIDIPLQKKSDLAGKIIEIILADL